MIFFNFLKIFHVFRNFYFFIFLNSHFFQNFTFFSKFYIFFKILRFFENFSFFWKFFIFSKILHFFQNFTFFPKFYIFFKILCILYFWKKNFECDTTNKRRTHWLDGAHNDCSFYCIRLNMYGFYIVRRHLQKSDFWMTHDTCLRLDGWLDFASQLISSFRLDRR